MFAANIVVGHCPWPNLQAWSVLFPSTDRKNSYYCINLYYYDLMQSYGCIFI